jgi:xylan 1,4-beta-xylosidase
VGGPSTARGEWVGELIDYGRANDCPPDYIITHCYNNDSENKPLSPFDGPQEDKVSKSPNFASGVMRGVKRLCDERNFRGEIHWNEWGSSWFPCDPNRETENEAAFIVKTMAESHDQADVFAYWCLSDIYNQVGYGREPFHGNYGMLNQQNIRKPNYLAHQLLCRLKEFRHDATVENGSTCRNAFCAGNEESQQVLLYNFQAPEGADPGPVRVTVRALPGQPVHRLKLFRITGTENNSTARWTDAGAEPYLSPGDAKRWKDSSALREAPLSELTLTPTDKGTEISFDLSGRGLAFLEWAHEPYASPLMK